MLNGQPTPCKSEATAGATPAGAVPSWPSSLLAAPPREARPPGPLSSWILAREGLHLSPPQGTFPLDCVPWVSPWNTKVWMPPTCPRGVIVSSAPGSQLFSQELGQALSVVSETKALTLLARLITFYLKLKFSNS